MDIIRRIKKISIAGLMMLALLVTGCGYLDETEVHDFYDENDRPVFQNSEYESFQQLFGDITYNELRDLVQDILDNLQSASWNGDITREDSIFIQQFLTKASEVVDNLQYNNNEVQETLVELLQIAHDNNVGKPLKSLLSNLAVDGAEVCMQDLQKKDPNDPDYQKAEDKCNMLVENLLPMLNYIFREMDFGNFKGIPLAVPDAVEGIEITSQDISQLTAALGHIVDPQGPYAEVYTQARALYALAKEREELLETKPTVGNTKRLAKELIATAKFFMGKLQDVQGNVDIDVDTDSLFKAIQNAISAIVDAYKADGEFNPEAVKEVMVNLWFDLRPESDLDAGAIMDAVLDVWAEEKPTMLNDTNNLMYAVGRLLSDENRTGYDGWGDWPDRSDMTDAERVLHCIIDGLNPEIQSRESLHEFLLNVLKGVSMLEGADNIHGIVKGVSSVNVEDMKDIDIALYQYMIQNNINGDPRGPSEEINMSVLRGVFFLLTKLYNIAGLDILEGGTTSWLLSNLTGLESGTENYPDIPNQNIVEWALGLMIVGMYEYPDDEYSQDLFPEKIDYLPGYPDPLEGLDWVFYTQNIYVEIPLLGVPFLKFNGLNQLLDILEWPVVRGLLGVAVGGISDPLPSLAQFAGGTGSRNTIGKRHKLFAILAPILKHYWDQGRILDFVEMATYINEINPDPREYKSLALTGSDATFKQYQLGHVLENIEGRYGRGLLYYALRGDSPPEDVDEEDAPYHKGDPLDPILDIVVRILKKFDTTPYNESDSLLDYMVYNSLDINYDGPTPEDLVNRLFEPREDGETIIDKIYNFLNDNDDALAILGKAVGKVILALHEDIGYDEDTVINLSMIFDILANGTVLDSAKKDVALVPEVRDALNQVIRSGIDTLGLLDDNDDIIIDENTSIKGAVIKDRLEMIIDIGLRILGGIVDDFQVLVPHIETIWNTFNAVVKDDTMTEDEKVTAILAPVRVMLNSPDIVNAAQHAVRVVLTEADTFGFADEAFILKAQELVGSVFENSDTLIDDIEVILPNMLTQLVKVDIPTDPDSIDVNGLWDILKKVVRTVIDEVGKKDSVLVNKAKIIVFKVLQVQDETYNQDGVFTDSTRLFEMLEALVTGEDPEYDLKPVFKFLNEATEKDVLAKFLSEGSTRAQSSFLRELQAQQEEDVEMILSMRLIRTVFTPYDGRPSIAKMVFRALNIHRLDKNGKLQTLDVNLFIKDLADIIYALNVDPESNPRFYRIIRDLLREFAASASY